MYAEMAPPASRGGLSMDYKELSKRMRKRYLDNLNGLLQEPDDVFSDFNKAATAITDLLSRAEAAEQKATELDNALSNASKVVKTMQESTIPYYRKRAEAAEKEVEWKNKVIEAAERRFMEAEARAEKAERERDAAISDLTFAVNQYRLFTTDIDLCGLCKFDIPPAGESGQTAECPGFYKDNCFEWRGQEEE